jgi:hypothetical protein
MTAVDTSSLGCVGADSANEAHAQRGRLNNGNPPGDYTKAPRCGAKTRRGTLCMAPAMKNGRCRLHGGCSTGPKTPEGLARSQKANWKHGRCSEKARADSRTVRAGLAWVGRCTTMLRNVDRLFRLLSEIARQVDANEPKGLRAKCVTAGKLWRESQSVLATAPEGERRRSPQAETTDRLIALMLEAGAAGDTPHQIWARFWIQKHGSPRCSGDPLSAGLQSSAEQGPIP